MEVLKKLSRSFGTTKLNGKIPKIFCPFELVPCSSTEQYRSIDGSCNNQEQTWFGMANSPYKRMIPPEYGDSIDSPRTRALSGNLLPNPRTISMIVHEPLLTSSSTSNLFLFFGQILDHDLASTASAIDAKGFPISCTCGSK